MTAATDSNDMIDLKPLGFLAARSAFSALSHANSINVLRRERSFSAELSGAPVMTHTKSNLLNFVGISFHPRDRLLSVRKRVFCSPLPCPLRIKSWARLVVSPLSNGITFYANPVRGESSVVSVFARYARGVMNLFQLTGFGAGRMLSAFSLAPDRIGARADTAHAGSRIPLGNVPILAGLSREVKTLSGSLRRFSLRNSFHLSPNAASTMFIVTQAA